MNISLVCNAVWMVHKIESRSPILHDFKILKVKWWGKVD